MGMDLIEISLSLEETFHLRCDDEFWTALFKPRSDASYLWMNSMDVTAGEIRDEIVRRLSVAGWSGNERAFDVILAELLATIRQHYSRPDITPQTPLHSILIPKPELQDWQEFARLFSVKLPDLIWLGPNIIRAGCLISMIGLPLGIGVGVWIDSLALGVLIGCCFSIAAICLSRSISRETSVNPKYRRVPPEIETVHMLAEYVHRVQPAENVSFPWNLDSVWNSVHSILVDRLCVDPNTVIPSARLIKDLGMG